MKLSEAIRIGSMLKPQAFGYFLKDGATCAQGAALDAVGALHENALNCHLEMQNRWPRLYFGEPKSSEPETYPYECPKCRYSSHTSAISLIVHLNNYHQLSRAEIADWLELHEPMESAEAVPESETAHEIALQPDRNI